MNAIFKPASISERIVSLDILRGFALFGIALVNIFGFNASFFDFGGFYNQLPDTDQSSFYHLLISLCADKFIFLYSFLFGYGFFLLADKFGHETSRFFSFYKRRMFYLALFGLLHIVLLWAGDILLLYAVAGTLLFFIRGLSSGRLIVIGLLFYFFIGFWLWLATIIPLPDALSSTCTGCLTDAQKVYPSGSYIDCMTLRFQEYIAFRNINLFYYLPKIIGVFIFGFIASKNKIHKLININRSKALIFVICTGVLASLLYFYYETLVFLLVPEDNPLLNVVYMTAYELTNLFIASFYILLILMLTSFEITRKFLVLFSWPGRMSLTNYIVQSIVFSIIMYGWGTGEFGNQNPTGFIWYPVVVFSCQVVFSYLWLKYFRQGPLEMLWRKLSYKGL
ncbi:MAG: DUF418 domain-containing protein [Bacteroidales bacterium]|nr:DUF418 domain-containing protein [Bacteroidales bacterium]